MIYTGNYHNCNTKLLKTYSISEDKGVKANYQGPYIEELFPPEELTQTWYDNKSKLDDSVNDMFYVEEYYDQVLKSLDPELIYQKIKNSIILCHEKNDKFCHRHIVAAWLEHYLNIKSYEIKINGNRIIILNRPDYIKTYVNIVIEDKPLIRKKEK